MHFFNGLLYLFVCLFIYLEISFRIFTLLCYYYYYIQETFLIIINAENSCAAEYF